jgi:hypothetical protein
MLLLFVAPPALGIASAKLSDGLKFEISDSLTFGGLVGFFCFPILNLATPRRNLWLVGAMFSVFATILLGHVALLVLQGWKDLTTDILLRESVGTAMAIPSAVLALFVWKHLSRKTGWRN